MSENNKKMDEYLMTVRSMYEHFKQGDTKWMISQFKQHPKFQFISQGPFEATENGTYKSLAELEKYFSRCNENWEITEIKPTEFLKCSDRNAIHVIGEGKGFYLKSKEKEAVTSFWDHTYWFDGDGMIIKFREVWSAKRENWQKSSNV